MLYIHIPFCHRKCSYCAFYSKVTKVDTQPYVDALCNEICQRSQEDAVVRRGSKLHTVYFGGGTPSMLAVGQIGQIVATIRRCYDLSELEEATLECNPEDVTAGFLQQLCRLEFFNRLSLGVQTLDDGFLKMLNRRHSSQQALGAIRCVADAGIPHLSVDMIYGLPGQSAQMWTDDLDRLADCSSFGVVDHLSAYALTIEPGTMLESQIANGTVPSPCDDLQVMQYDILLQKAKSMGFVQYEISNFERNNGYSRHNSRYWKRIPYMGVGASAHSFDGCSRRWNVSDIGQYIYGVENRTTYFECESLSKRDAFNEYVMTSLRTTKGIEKELVDAPFVTHLYESIGKFVEKGWLIETEKGFVPTPEGLLMADGMAADLFV